LPGNAKNPVENPENIFFSHNPTLHSTETKNRPTGNFHNPKKPRVLLEGMFEKYQMATRP
jgi:hypothetical protein